ncbi:unnamed protein product [Pylaiella littoralis]
MKENWSFFFHTVMFYIVFITETCPKLSAVNVPVRGQYSTQCKTTLCSVLKSLTGPLTVSACAAQGPELCGTLCFCAPPHHTPRRPTYPACLTLSPVLRRTDHDQLEPTQ